MIADKRDAFVVRQWLLAVGDAREPSDPSLHAGARCDREGCTTSIGNGRVLALDKTPNAVDEDCGRVSVLVTPIAMGKACAGPEPAGATSDERFAPRTILIGRDAIEHAGALALYADDADAGKAWRIVLARAKGQARPWMPVLSTASVTQPTPTGRGDPAVAEDDQ